MVISLQVNDYMWLKVTKFKNRKQMWRKLVKSWKKIMKSLHQSYKCVEVSG